MHTLLIEIILEESQFVLQIGGCPEQCLDQGGLARHASARLRLIFLFEQRNVLARAQAPDWAVLVLPTRDDARASPGLDRGIFRIWSAHRQDRDRRVSLARQGRAPCRRGSSNRIY